jgi:O-antigen/teichoic acid export membrane protein
MGMHERRKVALVLTLGANILLSALGVVTGVILARILGPDGRGELAAITLWPGIILTLGGLGIPHTIAYFVASRPEEGAKVYTNALTLSVFQSLLLVTVGLLIIPWALEGQFAHVMHLCMFYLISIPLSLVAGINAGFLQGLLRMREHSIVRTVPSVVYMVGLLVFFASGINNLGILVFWLLFILFISILVGASSIWKIIGKDFALDRHLLRHMVGYGLKTQAANSMQTFNLRLDQLIMSIFLLPQSLGYYVVAVTIAGAVQPLCSAVGTIALPDVASREAGSQAQRVTAILRCTFLILVPLIGLLILLMPWLVPLAFGPAFDPAIFPAQVLAIGGLFLGMNSVLTEGLRGMNRPGTAAGAELGSLATTVLLLYFLLPRYGITGAAVASVIAYATTFVIMAVCLAKQSELGIRALLPTGGDLKALLAAASFRHGNSNVASIAESS